MSLPESLAEVTVSVLGATGPQGRGLSLRFAAAGVPVVVGSRDAEKAKVQAQELAELSGGEVHGMANADAAAAAQIVVVAVPWGGHADLLSALAPQLAGKVVVDCVNPLGFDKRGAYALDVPEGSAAEQAAALLPEATVVGAFHNVSAVELEDLVGHPTVEGDVLVLGEVREATNQIQDLASTIPGMRGVYGGRLRNARQIESLTANLISINRRYKAHASLKITGI